MNRTDFFKLGIEVAGATISCFFWIRANRLIGENKNMVTFMTSSDILNPSQLLKILTDDSDSKHNSLMDFEENDLTIKFKGFLTGTVFSSKAFPSFISGEQLIVLSKRIFEPIYSGNYFSDSKEHLVKVTKPESILLRDPTSTQLCTIPMIKGLDYSNALAYIGSTVNFQNLSLSTRVLGKFFQVLDTLFQYFRFPMNIRGIKISDKVTEYGIKVGQTLVCFGEMIFDKRQKTLYVEKPYFLGMLKRQILDLVKQGITKFKVVKNVSLVCLVLFLILIIRRVKNLTKRFKVYLQNWRRELRMDSLNGINNLFIQNVVCNICNSNPKNIIFKPCWHFAVCKDCYSKTAPKNCPVCYKAIEDFVHIFVV